MGAGAATEFGGRQISTMISMGAIATRAIAGQLTYQATNSGKVGGYARREQEWAFQSNLAAGEITQIWKQIRAAEIREAIARREWDNHKEQIKNAEAIELYLTNEKNDKKGKKTNQAFYAWMKREAKGLYGQCFQLAFDVAKKAERALQHELGDPSLSYLQFGYLAGKEGLVAGEKLYLDIKRMEIAYHENNRREYELTKHVSLKEVDPLAVMALRATGRCTVSLPEELFDLDGPGHYFRRIKSVAVSIPCVAGPYASVNCTLTLQKSAIRKSPLLDGDSYARAGAEDSRFSDHFGSMQSIVTSTAASDGGLFETNLRDERYLPFEGSGVVSEWQLALPADPRNADPQQFDYGTITDVILHLRYTAREGGGLLRSGAAANLKTMIEAAKTVGSVRLLSARHEFPTEWAKFKNLPPGGPNTVFGLTLDLREEHYPFWSKHALQAIHEAELIVQTGKNNVTVSHQPDGSGKITLVKEASMGGAFQGTVTALLPSAPVSKPTLYFGDNAMQEVWLAVTWGKAP
jgi:hypothetical protein